jgi:hypothetical protein
MIVLLHGLYGYFDEIFYGVLIVGFIASIILAILGLRGKK